jgi:methylmalonyl-CoA decarboxylase subunit alpha
MVGVASAAMSERDLSQRDVVDDRHARAERIRTEMGGADKVGRMRSEGDRTVREHIEAFLDSGTFRELGTFSRSMRPEDRGSTPGDGKIGGHGLVEGRPVAVFGDDITVRRGSSSLVGSRKEVRLYERALQMGVPIVHFGETGGARIPDIMGAEGISEGGELFPFFSTRRHRVPMATAIVGQSFGGSSFLSALSDFVVMVRGSCLAVTSPRVFEVATGEIISFEDLGGVDVHARTTGQIDLGVEDDEEAYAAIRRWLSYLPPNNGEAPPRADVATRGSLDPDHELVDLVPSRRTRGYDMRRVVTRIADPGSVMEMQPLYARNISCSLARLDGWAVAFVANNPMFSAGVLDPQACHKIIRLITVCDAYQIPVIFLVDVPGFMVGRKVEHDLMLHWGMRMMQALHLCSTPTLTVCIRKAFGLAWQAMNGAGQAAVGLYVWPGAEIGFMDPDVGVNVAYGTKLAAMADPSEREAERARLAAAVAEGTSPYEAAGVLRVDEVIDPAETRRVLAEDLAALAHRPLPPPQARSLASWPSC